LSRAHLTIKILIIPEIVLKLSRNYTIKIIDNGENAERRVWSQWSHRILVNINYSCLKATIGSTLEARTAGYKPKIIPIFVLINKENKILPGVITVSIPAKQMINKGMRIPKPIPIMLPTIESTSISMRN
jgi:hypothetical protein